jgi:hypothetical protein
MKSSLNGLGSNSNGLILWENEATGCRIMFKLDVWPREAKQIKIWWVGAMGAAY